jgi:hypothetical protein
MLVLSFGTETKDYVSDNSATTFRASRTLPIFLCSLTAHTSLQKQIVGHQISRPHHMGGGCESHFFASYVWRWKRTKTKLVLNGCNVVGDAAITLKSEVHFNTPSQK